MEQRKAIEIANSMLGKEDEAIAKVCDIIHKSNINMREQLINIVASLCEIEPALIIVPCNRHDIVQARWLYWYSLRKMTNATYKEISQMCNAHNTFSITTISQGLTNVEYMIGHDNLWKRRWRFIKCVIDEYNNKIEETKD